MERFRKENKESRPMASLSVAIPLTKQKPVISQEILMWWAEAKFPNWGRESGKLEWEAGCFN